MGILGFVLKESPNQEAIMNKSTQVHQKNSEPSVKSYSSEQIDSANIVMENVRELAKVFEEHDYLVVEVSNYLYAWS